MANVTELFNQNAAVSLVSDIKQFVNQAEAELSVLSFLCAEKLAVCFICSLYSNYFLTRPDTKYTV